MKSKLQTSLGLECGIVQAPMAGGPTTPELVASVTAAGALGSFGLAYSTPDQIHALCQEFRQRCANLGLKSDCGWNANFFIFPDVAEPDPNAVAGAVKQLQPLAQRVDIDATALKHATQLPDLADQVKAALTYKPSLLSFHLGIPETNIIDMIRDVNCCIAISATSLDEATAVQSAGADFVVAQGYEAGGHRGVFDPAAADNKLTTLDLVKVISDNCTNPIIAAGGIMNGSDIATALSAGADAVQLGSAFLTVDECGSCEVYRSAIDSMGGRETQITTGFSGRPARGIRNLFMDSMEGTDALPFPWQNSLTGTLRKAAGRSNDFELMSLWAGAYYHKARNYTAAQLIETLLKESGQKC